MKNKKYPYIGITKDTGLKVVFIKPRTGFIIASSRNYSHENYYTDWAEEEFIPENKDLEKYSCVVVETIEDLKEIEEIEDSPYKGTFHFYYVTPDALPVIIWQHGDKSFTHTTEDDKHHRVLFKDYAIWSKDKEKAKEILNIPEGIFKNSQCVIAETIKDLKEIEVGLGVEKGSYFKHYYSYDYELPAVIWFNNDGKVSHNHEDDEYHRVLFKDYAVWSKDKEKAKEILNIPTTVEMTLNEICKALGKNIKIVKETK